MAVKKTYYHRVPGARFGGLPDGRDLIFSATDGSFTTDDPVAIKELDKVANSNASLVYTIGAAVLTMEEIALREDMIKGATAAFDNDKKITGLVQTVEMKQAQTPKPVLTSGAVPADLKAKLDAAAKAVADTAKSS